MMMYKLKHGDVVKILPILKKKGGFSPVEELRGFFIGGKGGKVVYDTPENHLRIALRNKSYKEKSYQDPSRLQNTRVVLCIYHEDQIKFTLVGKAIKDKLINGYKFDPRNNYQLKVSIEMKDTQVGLLPSFDKSEIIQQDWNRPNIDIDNQEAWFDWLRAKQPFYIEDFVEKNNVFNNIDILKKEGLSDYIYEIIAENREKKINQVLT
jgi:hypothetical protein